MKRIIRRNIQRRRIKIKKKMYRLISLNMMIMTMNFIIKNSRSIRTKNYETFANFVSIKTSCLQCKKIFSFRNKLHKHLKIDCKSIKTMNKAKSKATKSVSTDKEDFVIIKSIAFKIDKEYDLVFKK